MHPFICKQYTKGKWTVLGIVYAHDLTDAWDKAQNRWKSVTSVYDLYSSD